MSRSTSKTTGRRQVKMQDLVKKLKQRYGDKEVLLPDFNPLSNSLHLDIKRPMHVMLIILLVTVEHPPLLLAVVENSGEAEKEAGPQTASSKAKDSEDGAALAFVRQLARSLHAVLQASCHLPMCILSLVVSLQEEDPGRKVEEAVSRGSMVQPFSRQVMTLAKYDSILRALEQTIDKSAFLEDIDKMECPVEPEWREDTPVAQEGADQDIFQHEQHGTSQGQTEDSQAVVQDPALREKKENRNNDRYRPQSEPNKNFRRDNSRRWSKDKSRHPGNYKRRNTTAT